MEDEQSTTTRSAQAYLLLIAAADEAVPGRSCNG